LRLAVQSLFPPSELLIGYARGPSFPALVRGFRLCASPTALLSIERENRLEHNTDMVRTMLFEFEDDLINSRIDLLH
jgi:hypothetical protein